MFLNVDRIIPDGICWCGCESPVGDGAFFRQGHDKVAEAAVIEVEYGNVVGLLVAHGYGRGGKNPRTEADRRREVVGSPRFRVLNEAHRADGQRRLTPKHRFVPGTVTLTVNGRGALFDEDREGRFLDLQSAPPRGAQVLVTYSHTGFERQ